MKPKVRAKIGLLPTGHSLAVMCERGDARLWTQETGERCVWIKSDDGTDERQTVPADPPLHVHSRPFCRNMYEAIRMGSPVAIDPELSRK